MLQVALHLLYLQLADPVLLLFLFVLVIEVEQLVIGLLQLLVHFLRLLLCLSLVLFNLLGEGFLALFKPRHLFLPLVVLRSLHQFTTRLPLLDTFHVLLVLVLEGHSLLFLLLSGEFFSLPLSLQLANFLTPHP